MISWFTMMSQKNVSDNGSDWCSDTTRRRLIGGIHHKQGSKDARVRIVVLLTLSLIESHKYSGAVLLTALCVKSKIFKIIMS